MTAVPPPVPPEIVRRAAEALNRTHWNGEGCGTHGTSGCSHCYGPSPADADEVAEAVLDEVYGDIVEAARRDALTAAIEAVEALDPDDDGNGWGAAIGAALETLTDLLTATAPPRAPTASVSDQGADPRTPATPGAVSGHSGPREEDDETFTVSEIRAAFAAASPDDWGVPGHYETTMLLALRGSRSDD